jgi:hypothetical protein
MIQLTLPLNARGPWLMFNEGIDHEVAAARFEEKHGYEPARVWEDASNVFAGPTPKRKEITL